MKKLLFVIVILIFPYISFSQQTVLAQLDPLGDPEFLVEEDTLKLAFEDEMDDGTDVTTVYIEEITTGVWCLWGEGIKESHKIVLHVELDLSSSQFTINAPQGGTALKSCHWIRCNDCGNDCHPCDPEDCNGEDCDCDSGSKYTENGAGWLGDFY